MDIYQENVPPPFFYIALSKMFDIQNNHFLFVSCENCGYVEVYNPNVLEGKSRGQLGTVLDILFG
ncbi:hypothetical protein GC102_33265 [Paenibacillus sp. LMG 31460]|uniref:Nucleic acid-binding protein n=1 Tax=Paenibacillus germinis TaxID=2654979 RepID=A0ABX1ZB39_9BACL|nr:hypothetical protein [Paenibacillus germinis]